jgi:hypothetical protein
LLRSIEHPEEQFEEGAARFGPELVEYGALLGCGTPFNV